MGEHKMEYDHTGMTKCSHCNERWPCKTGLGLRIKELEAAFRPLLVGLVEGGCIVCGFFEEHHDECSVGLAECALAGEEAK